jgi:hypothetical protein
VAGLAACGDDPAASPVTRSQPDRGSPAPGGTGSPTVGAPSITPSAKATAGIGASPTSARTTPPASTGGKPGAGNTGVPAGQSLKVVRGDQVYTRDGQVISGLDIHGYVRIRAKNVVLKNSIVRGGPPRADGNNSAVVFIERGQSARLERLEIKPSHPAPTLDGVWAENATLTGLNIHDVVDGVKAFNNVTIKDSYIHHLSYFSDTGGGDDTHNDAVQTYEGNRNVLIQHNTLALGRKDNAAYQVTQDNGGVSTNLRIQDNWLDGGGCTLNFAHKGGPTPMTGIHVVNNRFGRNTSFSNCPILVSTKTELSTNSGNVWADTGKPIPAPQRHD